MTTIQEKVEHPKHYCRENAIECIDEMELVFGKEKVMAFCLCNAWKYRYRASDKNGLEDIKKSDWYLNKYRDLRETESDYTESNSFSPLYIILGCLGAIAIILLTLYLIFVSK